MLIDVARVKCNTATGTQDITADLGGADPVAAMLFICACDTDATAMDGAMLGVGFTDGVTDYCVTTSDAHGSATSADWRIQETSLIRITTDGVATNRGTAVFDRWVADGVRVDWTTAAIDDYYIIAVFFSGLDVSAATTTAVLSTQDTLTHVTDVGFASDIIFAITTGQATPGSRANGKISFGVATAAGNWAMGWFSDVAQTSTKITSYLANNRCAMELDKSVMSWSCEVNNIDAAGFDAYPRDGDGVSNNVDFLCLKFDAASVAAMVMDTPTSTGNDAQVLGIQPSFVGLVGSTIQTENTLITNDDAGSIGMGAFNAASEYSVMMAAEDGSSPTDTQSLSDDIAMNLPYDTGSAMFVASYVSLDATGFTLDFTTTDVSARKWLAFGIEETSSQTIEPLHGQIRFTAGIPTILQGSGAVTPLSDEVAITGHQPTITGAISVETQAGTLNITGGVPITSYEDIIIKPTAGGVRVRGYIPQVTAKGWIPQLQGVIEAWAQMPDACKEV